ncbi:MAG: penicillin-binding protein, partial [Cyclobacteriaceae bacterium]
MGFKKSILLRVRISFILVILFSTAVVYRIFVIQQIEGQKWRDLAEDIGLKFKTLKATRGNIYSDNGALLATSLPFYRLAFDPTVVDKETWKLSSGQLALNLSQFFKDKSKQSYHKQILEARSAGRRYILLNRKQIGYQEKKLMETWPIFEKGRMRGGVIFEKVDQRYRPFFDLGSRTIGKLKADKRGAVGLEYSFNRQLAGVDGQALFEKMSGGGWKPVFDGTEVRPKDGYDVHTTLDINIQDVAEGSLLKALEANNADYGSVVVMEVATGKIKAISNLSKNGRGKYAESYNYAVGAQGSREPGSTFKLASMLALFENTDLELTDSIDTGNGIAKFYDEVMKDHKPGGYGKLTVQQVFEVSSNIGVAKMVTDEFGQKPDRYIGYLKSLKLHKPLGFQLVGEGRPYIKDITDSTWSGVSLPWISHGYELKMTPLQTLALYNAVANNGRMMKPFIVKDIKKADKVIDSFGEEVIREKICSEESLQKVKRLLEGVVERGTAKNISDSFYKIAGKTGTAKKARNGRYTNEYYASFAGYFPAEAPRYSCIVVIDNPRNSRIYGSDVAAPVFKEVADKIYSIDVRMQEEFVEMPEKEGVFPMIKGGYKEDLIMLCNELGISNYSNTDNEWVSTRIVNNSVSWEDKKFTLTTVPDVKGFTLKDALYILENMGFKVEAKGTGRVEKQ